MANEQPASFIRPPTIAVGTVLGDSYEVTGALGSGGMGAIYIARHLRLPGKQVAIKMLLPEAARHQEAYARFRREAEVTSRLGHPNIVQVIDFNTLQDGSPYLVLEYLEGETLRDRLAFMNGPMDPKETIDIAQQVGAALDAAHHAGVVHRDLKPENVFLCRFLESGQPVDRIKVLDFGISKIQNATQQITQESAMLGTPQYMAPEQAQGKNTEIDERTDVFALGAMVYEMLSGAAAFQGGSLAEVVFQVVYQTPQPLQKVVPQVPLHMVHAVERALAKQRSERFASASAFVKALRGEIPSQPDASPDASYGAQTQLAETRPMDKPKLVVLGSAETPSQAARKRLRLGVGLVGAVLVGLFIASSFSSRRDRDEGPAGGGETGAISVDAHARSTPDGDVVARPDAAAAVGVAPSDVVDAGPLPADAGRPVGTAVGKVLGAENIPKTARRWLEEGRAALKKGDLIAAKRAAEKSLGAYRSGAVFGLLAEIYCYQQDSSAFAYYQNVRITDERRRVFRSCKAAGVALPPP